MPGLAQRNEQFSNATSLGFWSKNSDDISYNQLQKFWSELSPQARQELLKIDKQTLFEQARKNMYCSRCNGLLLEGFLQIVIYGKSLQQEGAVAHPPSNRSGVSKNQKNGGSIVPNVCQDEIQDPSVHPWGGLTTARDGSLTLLDCYLYAKSLKGLKNVFDSARARERERELLYPDACGGGGRGWISQGIASYGRGYGTRETCALHTARLSCDTLVDFWSALGEETRLSLLRMKEEDFIERLMYRFDSKRFCRDCRRNVIREFKELKELKRLRKEPHCTSWFCVANTDIQFEVSRDSVQADWRQKFADKIGAYHRFEWAVGSGEGKSDILEFENVGMNGSVRVSGLDLGGLSSCYITLRAWKLDGRCSELSFKAHALKGQQCVHSRLVVGDGFVTITRGESIKRFFEHAEEAEEEEDDDSMDRDGNDLDGECSRPQKHAKSPELAREFLLDAATVIFKEQVEKAFREGTARQNAHSIFVCLALKLLEERVHVAWKEIITLEKQMKLLEEEEKEKREEEERKERRRTKEREKKLRRKERLRGKEKDKEKRCSNSDQISVPPYVYKNEYSQSVDEEQNGSVGCQDSVSEAGDNALSRPESPDNLDESFLNEFASSTIENYSGDVTDEEVANMKDENISFTMEQSKFSRRKLKIRKDVQVDSSPKWGDRHRNTVDTECGSVVNRSESRYHSDNFGTPARGINGSTRQLRTNAAKSNSRNGGIMFNEKSHCSNGRNTEKYDYHCSCNQSNGYREKVDPPASTPRVCREFKSVYKSESASVETVKSCYRSNKYNQMDYMREGSGRPKNKNIMGNNPCGRDPIQSKKVWEPMESHKKYPRSNSDSDVTLRSFKFSVDADSNLTKSSGDARSTESSGNSGEVDREDDTMKKSRESQKLRNEDLPNGLAAEEKDLHFSTEAVCGMPDPIMSSLSNSDNCSSYLSEGDSNTASNLGNLESSSSSDSEDASQLSEGRDSSIGIRNRLSECHEGGTEKKGDSNGMDALGSKASVGLQPNDATSKVQTPPMKAAQAIENGIPTVSVPFQHQGMFPPLHNQNLHFPLYQTPSSVGYYHQSPVPWSSGPANGLMPFTHPNQYVYASPLGYGVNGNSRFCMQYGAVQHVATPVFNPGPVPVYQPFAKSNGINIEEQVSASKPMTQEVFREVHLGKLVTTKHPTVAPSGDGLIDHSAKAIMENNGFSLFHSGGPVALAAGCKSDLVPSKDGIVGGLSSQFSADHFESDRGCNKRENTIEEYNLFAASNGIKFSFF